MVSSVADGSEFFCPNDKGWILSQSVAASDILANDGSQSCSPLCLDSCDTTACNNVLNVTITTESEPNDIVEDVVRLDLQVLPATD